MDSKKKCIVETVNFSQILIDAASQSWDVKGLNSKLTKVDEIVVKTIFFRGDPFDSLDVNFLHCDLVGKIIGVVASNTHYNPNTIFYVNGINPNSVFHMYSRTLAGTVGAGTGFLFVELELRSYE